MTVAELVDKLSGMPPNATIFIGIGNGILPPNTVKMIRTPMDDVVKLTYERE